MTDKQPKGFPTVRDLPTAGELYRPEGEPTNAYFQRLLAAGWSHTQINEGLRRSQRNDEYDALVERTKGLNVSSEHRQVLLDILKFAKH